MKIASFIAIFFLSNFLLAQTKKYYSLEKNGKEYPKIIRYVMLNNGEKIFHDSISIFFNIDKQRFKFMRTRHKIDTCSILKLKRIKIVTINQLIKDEFEEHLDKTKKENINMPPPLNHYNSRVFIIEKIPEEKFIKYEVNWIYSIP
jgi:hypothetical protein